MRSKRVNYKVPCGKNNEESQGLYHSSSHVTDIRQQLFLRIHIQVAQKALRYKFHPF